MRDSTQPRLQALGVQAKADRRGTHRTQRRAFSRQSGPLSVGLSVLTWMVMAALAWGVVALLLRWL